MMAVTCPDAASRRTTVPAAGSATWAKLPSGANCTQCGVPPTGTTAPAVGVGELGLGPAGLSWVCVDEVLVPVDLVPVPVDVVAPAVLCPPRGGDADPPSEPSPPQRRTAPTTVTSSSTTA